MPHAAASGDAYHAPGNWGITRVIVAVENAAPVVCRHHSSSDCRKLMADDKYRSPLERRPKFVKAIGMISIENSSLEVLLAELLAALLGIHGEFGILVYFT